MSCCILGSMASAYSRLQPENLIQCTVADNANRRIPFSHKHPHGDWTRVPHVGEQTGGPLDQRNCVWMQWYCRLSKGLPPPSSRLRWLWSQNEGLQQAWNQDRRAVWDQVGLSHCRHDGLVTIRDETRLRRGYNDQSRRGHQCSETTLTGESRFHISTPLEIEPGSLMTGSKRVDYWTRGTVYECSEIAGSPQYNQWTLPKLSQLFLGEVACIIRYILA